MQRKKDEEIKKISDEKVQQLETLQHAQRKRSEKDEKFKEKSQKENHYLQMGIAFLGAVSLLMWRFGMVAFADTKATTQETTIATLEKEISYLKKKMKKL